jgi:hypothetical protein
MEMARVVAVIVLIAVEGEGEERRGKTRDEMKALGEASRWLLRSGEEGAVELWREGRGGLRKETCRGERLVTKLVEPGCLPRSLVNRFCYGQCNSFFVPRPPPEEPFQSCPACRPKRASWVTVTLSCPSLPSRTASKRVYKIKQCRCIALQ